MGIRRIKGTSKFVCSCILNFIDCDLFEFCNLVLVICYFPDEPGFPLRSNRFIRVRNFEVLITFMRVGFTKVFYHHIAQFFGSIGCGLYGIDQGGAQATALKRRQPGDRRTTG